MNSLLLHGRRWKYFKVKEDLLPVTGLYFHNNELERRYVKLNHDVCSFPKFN